jgi:hypothetical protein
VDALDRQIGEWRGFVGASPAVDRSDIEELEAHLRDQIADLSGVGLSADEAFLVAVKRLGAVDALSREFAREHSDRLWKQLVLQGEETAPGGAGGLVETIVFAGMAGLAVQIPRFLGVSPEESGWEIFVRRNAMLLVLSLLVWFFGRRRGLSLRSAATAAAPPAAVALVVNLYPWGDDSFTELLAVLHLPVAMWFVMGFAYVGGGWRSLERRMDFVRFSGEWLIYYVLIALGGGVLLGLTGLILTPVGGDLAETVVEWVVISGAAGAVIVAAWLVEAKKSVVENMAPVLTRIFTPLFAVMLVGAAVAYALSGMGDGFSRDLLTVFDALLIVILGLVLYGISASDSMRPPDWFDRVQLVAVVSALLLDLMVLFSLVARVADLGFTPNRVAALGLNLVLMVNLGRAAWLSIRFMKGHLTRAPLERWQMVYLPVFGLWALVVVAALPPVFGFG